MRKKSIVSILLVAIMIFGLCNPAYATDGGDFQMGTEVDTNDVLASAQFDLSVRAKQEATVILPNGETAVCGVEPVEQPSFYDETYENAVGTWHIYWNAVAINVEYYITISKDGKITDAYDQRHVTIGCVVTGCDLTFTSKKATGWWDYKVLDVFSKRGYLYASMNGTTLTTSADL